MPEMDAVVRCPVAATDAAVSCDIVTNLHVSCRLAAYPDVINNRMRAGCGGIARLFWKTWAMIDFADVDRQAASYQQRGGQPGLAYGIVLGGELVHAAGLGQRHVGGPAPDADTVFRIAS